MHQFGEIEAAPQRVHLRNGAAARVLAAFAWATLAASCGTQSDEPKGPSRPTAVRDSASVLARQALSIDVLKNDLNPAGGQLSVIQVLTSRAQGGVNADGTVWVQGSFDYYGPDSLYYIVEDARQQRDTGVIRVQILHPPFATVRDTGSAAAGGHVASSVLANDTLPPQVAITLTVRQPLHGTAVAGGSQITYSPVRGFTGTDSMWYVVQTELGKRDSASLVVRVFGTPGATPLGYDVVPLGTFAGTLVRATDVNDRDDVVGYAALPNGTARAVRWSSGAWTDLGTSNGRNTFALAINASGMIAGYAEMDSATGDRRPIVNTGAGWIELPSRLGTRAADISDSGYVLVLNSSFGSKWSSVWLGTTVVDSVQGHGLKQIVGPGLVSFTYAVQPNPFDIHGQAGFRDAQTGREMLAWVGSHGMIGGLSADAANERGDLVGFNQSAWVMCQDVQRTDLICRLSRLADIYPSVDGLGDVFAINNDRWILGRAYPDVSKQDLRFPVIVTPAGLYYLSDLLATPGWKVTSVSHINASGNILADAVNPATGTSEPVLLRLRGRQ